MKISIYTDDSGTFDCERGRYFVYGGVLFLSPEMRENFTRKYSAVEKAVRERSEALGDREAKSSNLLLNERRTLFRVTNHEYRFAIVIDIQRLRIRQRIANSPRDKQRFLDFAFKLGVKRFLQYLIDNGTIIPAEVESLFFYIDQHTTATNGRYELEEGLRREFLNGTINYATDCFFPPLFPQMLNLKVTYCDSEHVTLIRTADVVANRVYQKARHDELNWSVDEHFHVIRFPE